LLDNLGEAISTAEKAVRIQRETSGRGNDWWLH